MKQGMAARPAMSYWLMPESALDDPDKRPSLPGMASAAAQRAKAEKARKSSKAASGRRPEHGFRNPYLAFLTVTAA